MSWLYWYTNWLLGKDSSNFVAALRKLSMFLSTILFKSPNLFLNGIDICIPKDNAAKMGMS